MAKRIKVLNTVPLNFSKVKKLLYVLFAAAAVFTSCQKDSSSLVNITASDLTTINNQLKGTWLYPIGYQRIVEPASGANAVDSIFYAPAPSLQFDGGSHVNIIQDTKTTIKATYSLSAQNGMIYVDVTYPDGNDVLYQVLSVNDQTLKLESKTPYIPTNQTTGNGKILQSDVTMERQTAEDVNGHLIRVIVKGDKSYYSVSVSVTHTRLPKPADSTILLSSKINTLGTYTYEFMAQSGDQLYVDVLGDYTNTSFYAFYEGIPMAGNTGYDFQEIKTTTGWMVP
jgi:hypothetical protein